MNSRGVTSAILFVCVAAILGLLAVFILIFQKMRDPDIMVSSTGRLAMIGLALQNYESLHGHLPPAYVADETGKPMHSWRVLLLPYLGYDSLFERYDFSKPWNAPENLRLESEMPYEYRCPELANPGSGKANCVAVVGPGTPWPGPVGGRTVDFDDDHDTTILILFLPNTGGSWLEPRDVCFQPTESSGEDGVVQLLEDAGMTEVLCGMVTGRPRMVVSPTPQVLRSFFTVAGGERIGVKGTTTGEEFMVLRKSEE